MRVCLENLCPVYPGRSSVCHDPLSVRDLVKRLDTPAYGMLLDVGHAHVVAGFMGVETLTLVEPVLDVVRLFHVHDNLGARLAGEGGPSVDPLQLDLHLPPGSGTIPWDRMSPALAGARRAADDGDPPGPQAGTKLPAGGRRDGPRTGRRARSLRARSNARRPRMAPDQLPYPARAVCHVRATPLRAEPTAPGYRLPAA